MKDQGCGKRLSELARDVFLSRDVLSSRRSPLFSSHEQVPLFLPQEVVFVSGACSVDLFLAQVPPFYSQNDGSLLPWLGQFRRSSPKAGFFVPLLAQEGPGVVAD